MHAATLAQLKMQLYFGNMKYLYIVVIATRQFIFFLYFFSKNYENNGKNINFNLGFIDKFFILSSVFYYAKSELRFGTKIRPITCMKCFEIFNTVGK